MSNRESRHYCWGSEHHNFSLYDLVLILSVSLEWSPPVMTSEKIMDHRSSTSKRLQCTKSFSFRYQYLIIYKFIYGWALLADPWHHRCCRAAISHYQPHRVTTRYKKIQWCTMRHNDTQWNTMMCNKAQRYTTMYNNTQEGTTRYNKVQQGTTTFNQIQQSAKKYNETQWRCRKWWSCCTVAQAMTSPSKFIFSNIVVLSFKPKKGLLTKMT